MKDFDAHSVSPAPTFISSEVLALFQSSGHPAILNADFPNPVEWGFSPDEWVEIVEGPHKETLARVKLVLPDVLEVEISSCDGVLRLRFPWRHVRKRFEVGDFVNVVAGADSRRIGLVQSVGQEDIYVIERVQVGGVDARSVTEVFFLLGN